MLDEQSGETVVSGSLSDIEIPGGIMALSYLSNIAVSNLDYKEPKLSLSVKLAGLFTSVLMSINTLNRQSQIRKDLRHSEQYPFPKLLVEHIPCFERSNNQRPVGLGEVSRLYMPKLAYEGADFLWVAGIFATTSAFRTDTYG